MIDWKRLLRKARITENEQLCKYIKYRMDKNIYQRKEIITYWDMNEKVEKETHVITEPIPAKNFKQYCDSKYKQTIIEKNYIWKE